MPARPHGDGPALPVSNSLQGRRTSRVDPSKGPPQKKEKHSEETWPGVPPAACSRSRKPLLRLDPCRGASWAGQRSLSGLGSLWPRPPWVLPALPLRHARPRVVYRWPQVRRLVMPPAAPSPVIPSSPALLAPESVFSSLLNLFFYFSPVRSQSHSLLCLPSPFRLSLCTEYISRLNSHSLFPNISPTKPNKKRSLSQNKEKTLQKHKSK